MFVEFFILADSLFQMKNRYNLWYRYQIIGSFTLDSEIETWGNKSTHCKGHKNHASFPTCTGHFEEFFFWVLESWGIHVPALMIYAKWKQIRLHAWYCDGSKSASNCLKCCKILAYVHYFFTYIVAYLSLFCQIQTTRWLVVSQSSFTNILARIPSFVITMYRTFNGKHAPWTYPEINNTEFRSNGISLNKQ